MARGKRQEKLEAVEKGVRSSGRTTKVDLLICSKKKGMRRMERGRNRVEKKTDATPHCNYGSWAGRDRICCLAATSNEIARLHTGIGRVPKDGI